MVEVEEKTAEFGAQMIEFVEQPADPIIYEGAPNGTVRLLDGDVVVLVPTPSADPKDPLNLPTWHKNTIIAIVGLYSALVVAACSGLGAVKPQLEAIYPGQETKIDDLLTFPTLFMSIGNLVAMPLVQAIGRRPVFLATLLCLVVTGVWCAASISSLDSHVVGRSILSMAAGQSEALAPMMIQEVHFVHQRGRRVSWFVFIQSVGTAAFMFGTVYIVPDIGLAWWYGILTIGFEVLLILAIFFAVETRFDRSANGLRAEMRRHQDAENGNRNYVEPSNGHNVTGTEERILRPDLFGPRTLRHDVKLFHGQSNWKACVEFYKVSAQSIVVPTMLWLVLLNGAFLGVYVYQASTFATVLAGSYGFQNAGLGFVQLAQILGCVAMIPLLGYGSDFMVKTMSRRHGGMYQPEYRIITLIVPGAAVILSTVIYGQAAQFPERGWHWMAVAAPYIMGYFAFMGANMVGITYAVDSFPQQAGPLLFLICAGRGFISFALSYSTVPFTALTGYNGAMNIYAIICGVLVGMGIPAYFLGGAVRRWVSMHFWRQDEAGAEAEAEGEGEGEVDRRVIAMRSEGKS